MNSTNDETIFKPSTDRESILAVDIGGSKIKILLNSEMQPRYSKSQDDLTPQRFVEIVQHLADGWHFDKLSLGLPVPVGPTGALTEPENLGNGWVGFDFTQAFEKPVKVLNDAVMQALGSYEGGRMLFLGLGTGLGSAFIAPGLILSVELSNLRYKKNKNLGDVLGQAGLEALGKKKWNSIAMNTADHLMKAFLADYVVFGGGNAKYLKNVLHSVRIGNNFAAFRGGFRAWMMNELPVQSSDQTQMLSQHWQVA